MVNGAADVPAAVAVVRDFVNTDDHELGTDELENVEGFSRWLEQAKFNHTAHRMKDCETCHTFDFPKQLPTDPAVIRASDSAENLIPKRQVCLECHRPAAGSGSNAKGGARFDCIECHQYHGAEVHGADTTTFDVLKAEGPKVDSASPRTGEGVNR